MQAEALIGYSYLEPGICMPLPSSTEYEEMNISMKALSAKCMHYKRVFFATLLHAPCLSRSVLETWAATQAQRDDTGVLHTSHTRRVCICHISLQETKTNDSILALCKIDSVGTPTYIHYRRLDRLGHVACMSDDGLSTHIYGQRPV